MSQIQNVGLNDFFELNLDQPFGTPSNSLEQESHERKIWLLQRQITLTLIDQKDKGLFKGLIFQGPGGSGKSTLLFILATHFSQRGYHIIYLKSDHAEPFNFLKYILEYHQALLTPEQINSITEVLLSGQQNNYTQKAIFIFNQLRAVGLKGFKIAFMIDQWNAFFDDEVTDEAIKDFRSLFRQFSRLNNSIINGFVFCAVSSSFDPVGRRATRDDETVQLYKTIPLYLESEAQAIFLFKQAKQEIAPQLTYETIKEWTGNVPRMISYLQIAFLEDKIGQNILLLSQPIQQWSIESIYHIFHQAALRYYKDRLVSLFQKKPTAQNFQLTADFLRNKYLQNLDEAWINSGIFINQLDKWYPVCPPVNEAIINFISEPQNQAIRVMASDESTRWRAFELLFMTTFLPNGGSLNLPLRNLLGQALDSNRNHLLIQVDKIIWQNEDGSLPLTRILPGSLIICKRNFPVIDFFIHSKLGDKIFIQLSQTLYTKHSTKLNDLFKYSNQGKTTFKYFYDLAEGRHRNTSTLPEDAFYLYITTRSVNEAIQTRMNTQNARVVLVTAEDCRSWGPEWQISELYLS